MSWAGRVAVVTGGGSGLGAALAATFAEAGLRVAILDVDAKSAEATAASLRAVGADAISHGADVRDERELAAAASATATAFGRCDVVCANAGVIHFAALDRETDAGWRWILDVNLMGVVRTVNAFLPLVRETPGDRRIVVTSSGAALAPSRRIGVYNAAKYAVMGYAETLRLELEQESIGVSIVCPGSMNTPMLESSGTLRPADVPAEESLEDELAIVVATSPHRDVIDPRDAAAHVVPLVFANEPFIVTHGDSRDAFRRRVDAIEAAYERAVQALQHA
jgi:NAD(P)-dependent dehydrogenase (short-subunit alcohol dehydrogenase family)